MKIERDPSCMRALTYRVVHDRGAETAWVTGALVRAGWTSRRPLGELRCFRTPQGHEVLIVETTGRIQVRVSYTTALAERPLAALEVFDQIVAAVRSTE